MTNPSYVAAAGSSMARATRFGGLRGYCTDHSAPPSHYLEMQLYPLRTQIGWERKQCIAVDLGILHGTGLTSGPSLYSFGVGQDNCPSIGEATS